jgi:hypothetical protein
MQLSRFFTLEELTFSNTARAAGIDNQPTATEVESLRALCNAVLDPLREAVGQAIKINSGYRGPALNALVKGVKKSQHLTGQAADIQAPGMTVIDLFKKVIELKLPFDQVIYEVKGASKWVHVSHNPGANSGEILLAKFAADGSVTYPRVTEREALAMSEPVTRSRGPVAEPGYDEAADEPEREAPAAPAAPTTTAAKKAPAKKAAVPKPAPAKKVAAKKAAAKKKTPAKNVAAKRTAAKKAPATKVAAKKLATKKAPAKKATAKKATAKKAAAKKPTGQKAIAKKATAKKVASQKVASKKAAPQKAPPKAVVAKKAAKPAAKPAKALGAAAGKVASVRRK